MGAASASDLADNIDDSVSQDNEVLAVEESAANEEIVSSDANEETEVLTDTSEGNYKDLNELIQKNSNYGEVITLNKDYSYNNETDGEFMYGFGLSGYITIDGQGHTIDGKGTAGVFSLLGSNIVLKNIIIKNARGSGDGPVTIIGQGCKVLNSTFINCTSSAYGGAITVRETALNAVISDSKFYDNHLYQMGGSAIYTYNNWFRLENLLFVNNTVIPGAEMIDGSENYDYGTLYISSSEVIDAQEAVCKNLTFIDNYGEFGSAMTVRVLNKVVLEDLTFINNVAAKDGTLYITQSIGNTINNIKFINNTARNAAGLYLTGTVSDVNIKNAIFDGNFAIDQGGAATIVRNSITISNSEFKNNHAGNGIIAVGSRADLTITDSIFENNHAYSNPISTRNFTSINNIFKNNDVFEITKLLNITENGVTVEFEKNTEYDALIQYTISNNFTTIKGNGATVDLNNHTGFLKITGNNILIENLTIKNTFSDVAGQGALQIQGNNVTIKNVKFINNNGVRGCGIYITSCDNVTIIDSEFTNNFASDVGGALSTTKTASNVFIDNCVFDGNTANNKGGAIYIATNETKIYSSIFRNNHAYDSGAIYQNSDEGRVSYSSFERNSAVVNIVSNINNINDDVNHNLFISNKLDPLAYLINITDNTVVNLNPDDIVRSTSQIFINASNIIINGNGAVIDGENYHAILLVSGDNIIIENLIIKNAFNIANGLDNIPDGQSGLQIQYCNNLTIRNVTFINNKGKRGSAIYITRSNNVTVKDSTFKNNNAYLNNESNGIISLTSTSTHVTIDNCTFTNNEAGFGIISGVLDPTTIINNVTFQNNRLNNAIITSGNNNKQYSVSNCTFISNSIVTNQIFNPDNKITLVNNVIYGEDLINHFINISEGDNIILDQNKSYDSYSPIVINANNVVIDGNGSTINAHDKTGFIVNGTNVTFKNIKINNATYSSYSFINNFFIKAQQGTNQNGGAILFLGDNGTVINSEFVNNTAADFGAAIFFTGNGNVTDSKFIDNKIIHSGYTRDAGGAIYFQKNGTVMNSQFSGNDASQGGAIAFIGEGKLINSTLNNNKASFGGAVYFKSNSYVKDSTFDGNEAISVGGAIYSVSSAVVENTTIKNNYAETDATISCLKDLTASNSEFINNTAFINILSSKDDSSITNCSFINNTVKYDSIINAEGDDTKISDVTLTDNTGTGIKVTGDDSSIKNIVANNHTGTVIEVNGNKNSVNNITANGGIGTIVHIVKGNENTVGVINSNNHIGDALIDDSKNTEPKKDTPVSKQPTTLTGKKKVTFKKSKRSKTKTFKFTLTSNGAKVNGVKVTFKLDKKALKSIKISKKLKNKIKKAKNKVKKAKGKKAKNKAKKALQKLQQYQKMLTQLKKGKYTVVTKNGVAKLTFSKNNFQFKKLKKGKLTAVFKGNDKYLASNSVVTTIVFK